MSKHIGSRLDEFLEEGGLLAEAEAAASKRVIAWQIQNLMASEGLSKSEMARRMGTSRSALDRLLDPSNPSVTLLTIERAARALGKKVRVELAA
jgi:DNA-binding Xre family transcriptional regulator